MATRAVQVLKAFADETRLRILFVVRAEPLSVNEILEVLEMGQSRVSRHLRILAEAGVLLSERQGSRIYYGINPVAEQLVLGVLSSLGMSARSDEPVAEALSAESERDALNLRVLLDRRKRAAVEHFQNFGPDQDRLMADLVDANFYRESLVQLIPPRAGVLADLGCGVGTLAELLQNAASKTIGVDQSPRMLREAARRLPQADLRLGRLEHLPLRDGEADTVVLAMALHHLPEPRLGLREARRVLAADGVLLIAELVRHEEEAMRNRFGDFWLGFEPDRLRGLIESCGFAISEERRGLGAGKLESLCIVARRTSGRERLVATETTLSGASR